MQTQLIARRRCVSDTQRVVVEVLAQGSLRCARPPLRVFVLMSLHSLLVICLQLGNGSLDHLNQRRVQAFLEGLHLLLQNLRALHTLLMHLLFRPEF